MNVASQIAAAATGDRGAWAAIVDRFTPLVWATVRSHRLSEADAADVVQTTWLRLVEHLDRLNEPDRVGAWLATTARRECLRLIASRGRVQATDDLEFLVDDRPTAAAMVEERERDVALFRAVRLLSDRCQHLLRVLAADPAPSYEEIGAALDMPIGSIGPTRRRCMERLRDELGFLGITTAD